MGCIKRECTTDFHELKNQISWAKSTCGPIQLCIALSTPRQGNLLANSVNVFGAGNGFLGTSSSLIIWAMSIVHKALSMLHPLEDKYVLSWEMTMLKPEPRQFLSDFCGTSAYEISSNAGSPCVGLSNRSRTFGSNVNIDGLELRSSRPSLDLILPDHWRPSPHYRGDGTIDSLLKMFEGSLTSIHSWRSSQWTISSEPGAWEKVKDMLMTLNFDVDQLNLSEHNSFDNELLESFCNTYEMNAQWHKWFVPMTGLIEVRERILGLEGGDHTTGRKG